MKTIKFFLPVILIILISKTSYCQDFEIPKNVKLDKAEDYAKYENDIKNCVTWIEKTPMNEQTEKRKLAYQFLLTWISGAPNITIEINSNVVNFTKENVDFLMIFMGGWTKYAIENPNDKDILKGNLAGVKSVIKVYKMGNGIKKDKNVDKLVKLENTNELEGWIKEQLEKK